MTELGKYLEPIEVAGKSIGKNYQAYRIDGDSQQRNMRKDVGLGTCSSCDYFIFNENTLVLIEETQLLWQISNLKVEYSYLEEKVQTEFINTCIRNENKLKVYGSMLVLCRLSAISNNTKDLLNNRKYTFWLVASGMEKEEDTIMFDHLRDRLLSELRSALTNNIVDSVEIIPSNLLVNKLPERSGLAE